MTIEPVVATLIGIFIFMETINVQILGMGCILSGVLMNQLDGRKITC
ncbi:hypothetical protein [Oceanobacillus rekensis]|nr:hypothetical protein [Oceanobacillus rekensis]